jgi:hypothetical protein
MSTLPCRGDQVNLNAERPRAPVLHPPAPCTHLMGTRPGRGLFPWVSRRRKR